VTVACVGWPNVCSCCLLLWMTTAAAAAAVCCCQRTATAVHCDTNTTCNGNDTQGGQAPTAGARLINPPTHHTPKSVLRAEDVKCQVGRREEWRWRESRDYSRGETSSRREVGREEGELQPLFHHLPRSRQRHALER